MPRVSLDLQNPEHLSQLNAGWKFAQGYVPGEPNEGLVALSEGSPARLKDYDDSSWEPTNDLAAWVSHGLTFVWYRIKVTIPETVGGRSVQGMRVLFETCIDDYGEIWVDGECDRDKGVVKGFNVAQRVGVDDDPQPGNEHTIAVLAINGPLAAPGGAVFVRFATLAFEWRAEGY